MKYYIAVTAVAIILSMIGYALIQNNANENNIKIHTDVFNKLNAVLDQFPNATQLRLDQDQHYELAKIENAVVQNVSNLLQAYSNGTERVDREVQDHELLISINNTLSQLVADAAVNNSTDIVIENVTDDQIIGNITR